MGEQDERMVMEDKKHAARAVDGNKQLDFNRLNNAINDVEELLSVLRGRLTPISNPMPSTKDNDVNRELHVCVMADRIQGFSHDIRTILDELAV